MFKVKPQGTWGRVADMLMLPLMYIVQGTLKEVPQCTHRWNNLRLTPKHAVLLRHRPKLRIAGNPAATRRWWGPIPLFHLGGWKQYVVMEPVVSVPSWHVGWQSVTGPFGVSRIVLRGPVRMLIGPEPVYFFGLLPDGTVIQLKQIGTGQVGRAGEFAKVPLL